MQLDAGAGGNGAELDISLAVCERVVDEVSECLLDPERIDVEAQLARLGPKLASERASARGEARRDVREELVDIDFLAADRQRPLVGARDQEQVLGEPNETVRLLRRGAERVLELLSRAGAPERELELRLQQSERRAQLVARIRHEPPLVLDRGVEPREHAVERDREAADLVAARRHGEVGRLVGRHRLRPTAQNLDGTQRARREGVAAEGGGEQREGQKDEQLVPEVGERVAARGERARDHGDRPAPGGDCEHTPLASASRKPDLLVRPDAPGARCRHKPLVE
jgi:hypothetical protein